MEDLKRLAELIRIRNEVAGAITAVIGRPAHSGHIGEYIAAHIFNIRLDASASANSMDGIFQDGALNGRSVNIKWYARQEGLLDITPEALPDYYLVMTGPRVPASSSRGEIRPWIISFVYLFDSATLTAALRQRQVKIGIATSLHRQDWEAAEIYPQSVNPIYQLTAYQREVLALFA